MAGDGDLNIRINTTNDGRGAEQAKKDLEAVKKEARSLGQAYKEAGGGLKGLGAAGKQVAELYKTGGGGIGGVFTVLSGGGAKAAAAIGGLTTALLGAKKALMEFGQAEQSVRGMQAALAQNGQLTDEVNKRYQELASTLQELTGRADDEWIDVLTRLTQFGATPGDIDRHVEAVKNLAGIMGGDLNAAAAAVSKAMQGEFHSFSRLGIQIDEHATKIEKLDALYRELAQRGGGQLEAQAESLNGQFAKFKNNLSDFFEAIGQWISNSKIAQVVLYGLGATLGWLAEKIGGIIPAADGMRNALKKNTEASIDAERYNKQYAESLKETSEWANAVADALQRQSDIKKAARQAEDEATDAKMAFDIALVDRQEKLGEQGKAGGITKDEAIRRRAIIRERVKGEKFKREQDGRTDEALTAQQRIDNNLAAIEEAERLAAEAKAAVVSKESVEKQRLALKSNLDSEVEHWERNYAALIADPASFSNPELGVKAGPKWGKGLHDLGARITQKVNAARAARDKRMGEFDATMPAVVEGSEKREHEARKVADETARTRYAENNKLQVVIEAIEAEKHAATKTFRMQAKTSAVAAGTELLTQNPNAKPNAIQDQVMQASGAFPGPVANLGASVENNSTAFNQVMAEALRSFREQNQLYSTTKDEFIQLRREVMELKNQFKHSRNR